MAGLATRMLELGHGGAGVARGVCGASGGWRHEVGLIKVSGILNPTNMLHVAHPDVLSDLASPNGVSNEGDDVSENYEGVGSARKHERERFRDSRAIQMRKANAAIAWVAPQTVAER